MEPVSPMGQYLDSNFLCVYILGVLEFEVPIHNLQIASLIKQTLLSIDRFTSIMVCDEKGVKRWKEVEVKLEDHIIEPKFIDGMLMDSYDKAFGEYLSKIAGIVITIMSYMGMIRVTTATEKGFIDEQKLVCYLNHAFEILCREAAKEK
ncbi:hypothetical protein VNO77_20970 [Canavalia gladiata]|uniref:O-acyltransferase WSD1 C-terminal domain-containing protein n=1 Tax=Canavalia gladiata TaxID=3824 RepID=A0AAN9LVA0_CANGL